MRERKYKKVRSPKKVFLVVCEGETEKIYIEMLKREYRVPITIKTRVSGNSINSRLINQYIVEAGLNREDDYHIFYVYDGDIEAIMEKISKLPGTPLFTNPCFELWYLLHLKDHSRNIGSNEILKVLRGAHSVWRSYSKGSLDREQTKFLVEKKNDACMRALQLPSKGNPSSGMWQFIQMLENSKNG